MALLLDSSWVEADPMVQFDELLHVLEHCTDVSTEYEVNLSASMAGDLVTLTRNGST